MAGKWYFQEMGTAFGPITADELKEFASKGRVGSKTLVRKGTDGTWITAETVKGLFSTATDASTGRRRNAGNAYIIYGNNFGTNR